VFGSKVLDGLNCTVKTIPKNDLQKYSSANLAAFGACYFRGVGGWSLLSKGHNFQGEKMLYKVGMTGLFFQFKSILLPRG